MSGFVAALPMYDWPEVQAGTDAQWARLRDALRIRGIDAPVHVARRNADLPPVPGGIRDAEGTPIAPDPATLPPDGLDLTALWLHPALLLGQTCWGPMGLGLARHVQVVGQPDYSSVEGGQGQLYSSAILMRADPAMRRDGVAAPDDGRPVIPLEDLLEKRFAYNSADSMSGILALMRDLEATGESIGVFSDRVETHGHRASIIAVADGHADACAVDCRSWALARCFEPKARHVEVVGWTARRKGLPFITARTTPGEIAAILREVLAANP